MAQVVVRRRLQWAGGARRITVAIDRKVVAELKPGGRHEINIAPGWYGVAAEWSRGSRSASFDNSDGEPVEIVVSLAFFSLGRRPRIAISSGRLMSNAVDADVRRDEAIEAARSRVSPDKSPDRPADPDGVSGVAPPSLMREDREVAYNTSDWSIESVAAVCANLERRNVDYYLEEGRLVVDARHEALLDNMIGEVDTAPSLPKSPPQVAYSTATWSTQRLDLIVDQLSDHGIVYRFEDGELVVDAEDEAICDKVILDTSDDG